MLALPAAAAAAPFVVRRLQRQHHAEGRQPYCHAFRESWSDVACGPNLVASGTHSAAELRLTCQNSLWYGCYFDADMGACVLHGRILSVTSHGLLLLLLLLSV